MKTSLNLLFLLIGFSFYAFPIAAIYTFGKDGFWSIFITISPIFVLACLVGFFKLTSHITSLEEELQFYRDKEE